MVPVWCVSVGERMWAMITSVVLRTFSRIVSDEFLDTPKRPIPAVISSLLSGTVSAVFPFLANSNSTLDAQVTSVIDAINSGLSPLSVAVYGGWLVLVRA